MDESEMRPAQPPKAARARWLKPVLALSLALNLAVAGLLGGAFWRHGASGETERARGPGGITLLRALEREDRRAVLRAARAGGQAAAFDRSAHEAAVIAALRAEPFDAGAVGALALAQSDAGAARIAALAQAWQAQVLAMSAAGRAEYADRLEALRDRRGAAAR